MQRIVKPKTQQGRRALEKREPKVHENTKNTLFLRGGNTSQTVTQALKELHMLKKPNATLFSKKNTTRPFEDQSAVEFFSSKADSSLFMFGCHSKKRPNDLIIGRLFDGQVLDMAEFGVEKFVSMQDIKTQKTAVGIKPCIVISGEFFEENDDTRRVKNLLIDFFRGENVNKVCLSGLEHVINIHAVNGKIYIRNYRVLLKKSGSRTPRVELESIGPSLDLSMRRTRLASDDLFKRALKKPPTAKSENNLLKSRESEKKIAKRHSVKVVKMIDINDKIPKKKKNISRDELGNKLGRIHMKTQAFDKLQARKLKGLKRKVPAEKKKEKRLAKKQKTDSTS